jgi:nitrate/nitrite transporter NarK
MQIPSGLLADAVGPRRVGTAAAVIAAIGTVLSARADSLWMASLGRGLIGASVAVAFVACMKLAGHWFPANRFATLTGVSPLIGNLGGVLAGVPLPEAVAGIGWRMTLLISAGVTAVRAVVVWQWVRDDPSERGYASHAHPEALNTAPWAGSSTAPGKLPCQTVRASTMPPAMPLFSGWRSAPRAHLGAWH